MDLFYPELCVQIGSYTLKKGISVTVSSCHDRYFDWASVRFTGDFSEKITLARLDPATVYLGYDGQYDPVFTGYVTKDFALADSLNEVILKDAMIKLESTRINNTFVDCEPVEIVNYACQQSEISSVVCAKQPMRKLPCYALPDVTALAAIQGIGKAWGINPKFYFLDNVFYWGEIPPQKQIYHFEYAKNLIRLTKENGCWAIETVSAPFVKHSQKIKITHPQVSGTYEVHKVVHRSSDAGFIRSTIYFRG